MRRATVRLPADLAAAIDAYLGARDDPPTFATLTRTALREYLANRGHLPSGRRLHLTPAEHGSGLTDVSVEHDRELAQA